MFYVAGWQCARLGLGFVVGRVGFVYGNGRWYECGDHFIFITIISECAYFCECLGVCAANSFTSSDTIVFLEGIRVTTLTRLEREFAMFVQLLSSFAAQLLRAEKLDRRVVTTSSAADQVL